MRQSPRAARREARREARSARHTPPAGAMSVRSATARREMLGTPAATSGAGIHVLVSSLSTQAEYGAKGSQASPGSQPPSHTRSTKPNPKTPHEENPQSQKAQNPEPKTHPPEPHPPIPQNPHSHPQVLDPHPPLHHKCALAISNCVARLFGPFRWTGTGRLATRYAPEGDCCDISR